MKNIFLIIFVFFAHLDEAKYSAEYNALVPEDLRPRKSPEWWKDGMRYTYRYWPQHSESPACGKKGEEGYGAYHFYEEDPRFIKESTLLVNKLNDALRGDDKKAFASLISYPMLWNILHEYDIYYYIYLHTPDQVIYHYDAIMNQKTKKAILEDPPSIVAPNGFPTISAGRGALWIQCDMKIFVVNNLDHELKAAKTFREMHQRLIIADN